MTGLLVFVGLASGIICGGLAGQIANAKGWNGANWQIAGFLFGPLGLLAAAGLPDQKLRLHLRVLAESQGVSTNNPGLTGNQNTTFWGIAPAGGDHADADFTTGSLQYDLDIVDAATAALSEEDRQRVNRQKSRASQVRATLKSEKGEIVAEAFRVFAKDGKAFWKFKKS